MLQRRLPLGLPADQPEWQPRRLYAWSKTSRVFWQLSKLSGSARGLAMDSNTDQTIGKNVRRARRFAGLTLEQLAGQIGKSKGWLSLVENGKVRLEKRQDIARIAEVLAVSADALLGEPAPE